MKFQESKSYLWLFPIFIAMLFGSITLSIAWAPNPFYGTLMMPLFFAIMFVNEIRSEVLLDGLWRATFSKQGNLYKPLIIWKSIAIALLTAICLFLIWVSSE